MVRPPVHVSPHRACISILLVLVSTGLAGLGPAKAPAEPPETVDVYKRQIVPSIAPGLVRCSSNSRVGALVATLSALRVTLASPKSRTFA